MAVPRGAAGMLGGRARAAINRMVARNNTEVVILSFAPARLLQFRCVRSEREPAFTGLQTSFRGFVTGEFRGSRSGARLPRFSLRRHVLRRKPVALKM